MSFSTVNRTKFNKDSFIAEYGQKVYDSFTYKNPESRTNINPVNKVTDKPQDENILRLVVGEYGEIAAGKKE